MSGSGSPIPWNAQVRRWWEDDDDTLGQAFCPACRGFSAALNPGRIFPPVHLDEPPSRQRSCPHCGSLERHRVFALLLRSLNRTGIAGTTGGGVLLDVAPAPVTTRLLREFDYSVVGIDFDPAADGRRVDLRTSLTALPLADDSVPTLVCSHVLEHIPDDAQAMREIARVLPDDGLALLFVPHRPSLPTDEDVDVTPEVAAVRFFQADHVRLYGHDFADRLRAAGLQVVETRLAALLGYQPDAVRALRIDGEESVWLARPVAGPALPDAQALAGVVQEELLLALLAAAPRVVKVSVPAPPVAAAPAVPRPVGARTRPLTPAQRWEARARRTVRRLRRAVRRRV